VTEGLEAACSPSRQFMATRCQLATAGVTKAGIAKAVADLTLVVYRRGVFGRVPLPARARYLLSDGKVDPGYLAQVRDALLALGPTAAAAGRTAAIFWCFDMFVEPDLIEVVVARGRNRTGGKGLDVTVRDGVDTELREVLGFEAITITSALATVLHCALSRPLVEAVVIADSALRIRALTVEELIEGVRGWDGKPGAARLRRVLALVDPDAESVLESLLRVLLHEHGMHPDSQVVLERLHGGRLGRVDFCFVDQRLVIECDGRRWHDPQDARDKDRRRDNELERAGWRLVRVTWEEVVERPQDVVRLVRDCLDLSPTTPSRGS
jgi:very-short-patch-repair endonuclease